MSSKQTAVPILPPPHTHTHPEAAAADPAAVAACNSQLAAILDDAEAQVSPQPLALACVSFSGCSLQRAACCYHLWLRALPEASQLPSLARKRAVPLTPHSHNPRSS